MKNLRPGSTSGKIDPHEAELLERDPSGWRTWELAERIREMHRARGLAATAEELGITTALVRLVVEEEERAESELREREDGIARGDLVVDERGIAAYAKATAEEAALALDRVRRLRVALNNELDALERSAAYVWATRRIAERYRVNMNRWRQTNPQKELAEELLAAYDGLMRHRSVSRERAKADGVSAADLEKEVLARMTRDGATPAVFARGILARMVETYDLHFADEAAVLAEIAEAIKPRPGGRGNRGGEKHRADLAEKVRRRFHQANPTLGFSENATERSARRDRVKRRPG